MSRTLEIPDIMYDALQKAAEASGMTPIDWIAAHLATEEAAAPTEQPVTPPQTLADLFAKRVGGIGSGGVERLSENGGEKFTDHLEDKRKAGRL